MHRTVKLGALALALLALAVAPLLSCRATIENRSPLGERFPAVTGESLAGDETALPDDLAGAPAVLLLGYDQDAQFDADRGLFGLLQARTPVRILEVPTIPGLIPSLLDGTIDEGMRSGIPSEDWASVVTVYGSPAREVVALTGNENGRNMRVLLLDRDGVVRWFHDRGYSAGKMLELDAAARALVDAN
jgi:hypothetical protein